MPQQRSLVGIPRALSKVRDIRENPANPTQNRDFPTFVLDPIRGGSWPPTKSFSRPIAESADRFHLSIKKELAQNLQPINQYTSSAIGLVQNFVEEREKLLPRCSLAHSSVSSQSKQTPALTD